MSRIRLYITILFAYTTLAGLVTFSLFICQEASQTAMFGTWPAKDVQQWDLVLTGVDLMEKINRTEKIINWTIGWIQPLAFFSYRSHTKAIDYYIKANRTEVFIHQPELMIGRKIEFHFRPKKIEHKSDGRYLAVNGKLGVYVDSAQTLDIMSVSGYVKKEGKLLIISASN